MTSSDHERCSELLPDHTRGHLDAAERAWVEDHLAGCSDCRAEETALRALAAGEVAPLTEMERARLRRAVLATPAATTREAPSAPAPGARGGRLLQILGTAALLAMIGGFIYTTGLSGGNDAENAAGSSGEALESVQGQDLQDEAADAAGEEGAGGAGSTAASQAPRPEPTFERSLGQITGERLNKLGRRGLPLVVFSRAYGVEQVPELQSEFRDQLAVAAGPRGDTVRRCTEVVTDAFPNALPAYGALATLERLGGREVLVLAFAWTDDPSGSLDQSMVWAWPADNCDQPVEYFKNVIKPQG